MSEKTKAQQLADALEDDISEWGGVRKVAWPAADELRRLEAEVQALRSAVPAGWKPIELVSEGQPGYFLVPKSLIDEFPEINPSNYDHDDACALNIWGCKVVTNAIAAAPQPAAQPTPVPEVWLAAAQASIRASGVFAPTLPPAAQPAAQPTEPAKDIGVEQDERVFARIAAMKAQQAPAGEPVGVVVATRWNAEGVTTRYEAAFRPSAVIKAGDMLYTCPAVPMTDEQIKQVFDNLPSAHEKAWFIEITRAIEAAHKIGGAE